MFIQIAQATSILLDLKKKYRDLVSRYVEVSLIQKVGRVRSDLSKEYIRSLIYLESIFSNTGYPRKDSARAEESILKGIFLWQTLLSDAC